MQIWITIYLYKSVLSISCESDQISVNLIIKKFNSVERIQQHLYSFNSCILYTWVSLEALNNLYKLLLHTPNSYGLWVDLYLSLFLSSLLFDVVFFMGIAAIHMCVAAHGARRTWILQLPITVLFQLFLK